MFVEILLLSITSTLLLCYWNIKQIYTTWLKCNIPFEQAHFPYGNVKDVGKTMHLYEFTTNLYKKVKNQSPLSGFHVLTNAAVVLTDLDVIKKILVTDSNLFMDRGMYVNLRDDALSGNLFNLDGSQYLTLHKKLIPAFESESMKHMILCVERMVDRLLNHMSDSVDGSYSVDGSTDLDMKDILSRYTTDVMGTIFLGTDCNSLKNENTELESIARQYLGKNRERTLKYFFRNTYQETAKNLKITETPKLVADFFYQTLQAAIKNREVTKTKQNDLIDLLIELRKSDDVNENSEEKSGLTTIDALASTFMFFVAGFETNSTTLSYCLFELAKNKVMQDKLRKHVTQVFQHHNDKLQYDTYSDLTYLDKVLSETLRKYPPSPILFRTATTDYQLPNTDMVIPTGTQVMVPIYAIHHDETIYEKPQLFDPERFTEENIKGRHPFSYIPFGNGPRACIGKQFALMQLRIVLANLIKKYKFSICSKTPFPLKFEKKASALTSDTNIWLNAEPIKTPF